jgi:RNA polymerase sporulation-specific sigma factor
MVADTSPDVARRNALAERWLPLVNRVTRDFPDPRVDRDDLVGVGRLALVIACETADPAHDRLKYYLARPIRWAMRDEDHRRAHFRHERSNVRLNAFLDRDDGPGAAIQREDEERAARELVERLLRALSPRERLVVRLVFGLGGDGPLPQADVARELDVSHQHVWSVVQRALRKMRERAGIGDDRGRAS